MSTLETRTVGDSANNPLKVIIEVIEQTKILDEQQRKIASEIPEGPQRIRGLAGTGKTIALATKRTGKIAKKYPQWKIAIVFFTQSLYQQIRELVYHEVIKETDEEPDWNKINIFHAWGSKEQDGFYRNLALKCGKNPMNLNDVTRIHKRYVPPSEAFQYVCQNLEEQVPEIPVIYDAIIIDEGQDLPPSFYRLAWKTLSEPKRLYWAYDEAQGIGSLIVPEPAAIFGRHLDGTPVVDLGGNKLPDGTITPPVYENGVAKAHILNICYRTPGLLLMTAHAINMGLFRSDGPLQGITTKKEWEKLGYTVLNGDFRKIGQDITITRDEKTRKHPVDQNDNLLQAAGSLLFIKTFSDETQEQEWIAEQVAKDLQQGFAPSRILITSLEGEHQTQYFAQLQKALSNREVQSIIAGVDTNPDVFRKEDRVTIASIYRAKGNEAFKVYAGRFHYATRPDITVPIEAQDFRLKQLRKRNEAFVALTRTRAWCVVTGLEDPIFDELQKASEQYPNFIFPAFNQATLARIYGDE